jgi:endonuclease/exonuclease/phosphatase (EEP) superfamily protein YafD
MTNGVFVNCRWKAVVLLTRGLFGTLIWLATSGTILGFAGKWWWRFEQASHFRVQWFVLLTASVLVLLALQRYKQAALLAALAAVNLSVIVPLYLRTHPSHSATNNSAQLRIVSINVRAENEQHEKILTLVRQTTPDFLTLFEVNESWNQVTRLLRQEFTYSQIVLSRGHFGLALFSRYPINRSELKEFASSSVYAIIAHLTVHEQPLTIIGAHVLAPLNHTYWHIRNTHLAALSQTVQVQSAPVLLIGDLNVTPWSPYFRALLRDSALNDGRRGFGLQLTWPVRFPPLRIPIDHCLISPSITIRRWTKGPEVGSDHFPIIVDFSMNLSPS